MPVGVQYGALFTIVLTLEWHICLYASCAENPGQDFHVRNQRQHSGCQPTCNRDPVRRTRGQQGVMPPGSISPVGVVEGPNCNRAVRRGCMGALWHADTGRAAYVGSWAPRRAHMAHIRPYAPRWQQRWRSRPWVLWRAPIAIGPSVGVVWAPFGMLIRAVRPTWGLGHPGAPTHNRDPGTETETQSPPCRAHRDPVLRTETQVRATETQAVVRDSATETQAWVVL